MIEHGIPRFVAAGDNYASGFGYQWNRWRHIQIDRLAGHGLTEARLLSDTGWERDWFTGKVIFDGGAGAGRFSDVMAALGARVVALDLSGAIEACRETTRFHGDAVQCIQASLYAIPLRSKSFDGVHCAGVIQHTPDPEKTILSMPRLLKPGAKLGYNFYEVTWGRRVHILRALLRLVTPYMPQAMLLGLCRMMVVPLFPLSRFVSRIRYVRFGLRFLPICATHDPRLTRQQQFDWTFLDTFDWYNPRYDRPQRHERVADLLRSAGLVEISSRAGIARAARQSLPRT
ncbi:MAG: class I SAM-dependent methyltransferase [Rhodospirillaceae bacterium]